MANLKDGCTASIYTYAPLFRQANAALYDEHKDFVDKVLRLYRKHYQDLKQSGRTEWEDLPQEFLDEYFSDKPY
jgi:vacuolar-type H+-ATPase subunit C/Vma6|tara:strand:- start:129 stop:350 length:222 start_codon:yes stop_codon:yes gene_type:complete